MARKLPTFILSGLQQAGKSSVLKHLLQSTSAEKTAVIDQNSQKLSHQHLPGCSCCSGRLDLVDQVQNLSTNPAHEYLLIETSSISDPATIAESLTFEQDAAEIFAMITVVDASTFLDILFTISDDEDDQSLAESLIFMLEFADIIVINKTDLIDESTLETISAHIQTLNRSAQLLPATYGAIEPGKILPHKVFDFDQTTQRAGWLHALENPNQSAPQQFVYQARRPFHPQRLLECIESGWPGVFRSKGSIWLATRDAIVGDWSHTGPSCALEPGGYWLAALPRNEWPDDPETLAWATQNWDAQAGDRHQEIAFLGTKMDPQALTASLNACLVTDEEFHQFTSGTFQIPDPFPQWELDPDF